MNHSIRHWLSYLILTVMLVSATDFDAVAQRRRQSNNKPRTSATIKKEQKRVSENLKNTNRKIEANRARTLRSLNQLDLLNADIDQLNADLRRLQATVDSATTAAALMSDTLRILSSRLDGIKQAYTKSVRATQSAAGSHSTRLAFLFASESFSQAYRRMRYLREYSQWQTRQAVDIKKRRAVIDARRLRLDSITAIRTAAIDSLQKSRANLDSKRASTDRLVKELRRESAALKKALADNNRRARDLDSELERVIAQEQRKAAEEARKKAAAEEAARKKAAKENRKKETATTPPATVDKKPSVPTVQQKAFADCCGTLPFPVNGKYRIVRGFGKQQHPQLPKVTINNSGIDIETSKGTTANAVFDGKVSAIFQQPGFNNIVMLRHGEYLTIYANLVNISVKNGDTVSTGQPIGTIYSDSADNDRTTLHFEIRHEKEKLDPTIWLKH